MLPVELAPQIHWIGVNDRATTLFESIWPIPGGVSYNSYLIKDEKSAVIDISKEMMAGEYLAQLQELVDLSTLSYIVVNHMEPDHSGALRLLRHLAPNAVILCTQKAKDMLAAYYNITENVQVVADGQTVSLGQHTLKFVGTPFVHWPETMMTYETTTQILFSCDGFGGYGALPGVIFDDEYANLAAYEAESLRYFTNIVSVFSKPVLTAISKLSNVPVNAIAPSHGLVWRKNPDRIIELYRQWSTYATSGGQPGVTLLYASMYGNTERAMEAVAQGLAKEKLPFNIFNVSTTHVSYILPSLWSLQGVVVGAPTYEGSLFPPMQQVLDMAAGKKVSAKKLAVFGSYGWKSSTQAAFQTICENAKWEMISSFEFLGGPTAETLRSCVELGSGFAQKIKGG
ncbi:MAG TPA: FprA family A-type flavoprotein [Anaerolineaceae bacterium]|nr:FprA family A-type flavoprotein [Anaerolineaceae bacterium]HPN53444.1 FprA family A-type flavoprotein [Anaerolineaceae bacterium]